MVTADDVQTYGEAREYLHDSEVLDEIVDGNTEYRVEEMDGEWGNGTYSPDCFITNLYQRAMSREWIEMYQSDFFRDGITFDNTEAPYILMIKETGTHLIPVENLMDEHDGDLDSLLEMYHQLRPFEQGKTKIFYIDWGYLGEVVV